MRTLLVRPLRERRETARARAECFGWDAAVDAFHAAHDAAARAPQRRRTATNRSGVPGSAWAAEGRSAGRTTPITG
ncbi:hypothetical protein GCM10018783_63310 [Streptomyces griseosporeus]|nr:hypothetical protein GCM10018783_63310 [Streptomyces griseosporeus]